MSLPKGKPYSAPQCYSHKPFESRSKDLRAWRKCLAPRLYETRLPSAALAGWVLVLAGVGLMLLGYQRQVSRAGLPSNPSFFLAATLGVVALAVGWGALRGAIPHLDDSLRNGVVSAGVSLAALGVAWAAVALFRWLGRLTQEQQAVHSQMAWALLGLVVPALGAAAVVTLVVWFWLRPGG
jgi:hypothetical membrane protein